MNIKGVHSYPLPQRPIPSQKRYELTVWLLFLSLIVILVSDPAMANKFQTIGSGVTGSVTIKKEFIKNASLVASGVFFTLSVLALILHEKYKLTANYAMAKPASIIWAIIGVILLTVSLLI